MDLRKYQNCNLQIMEDFIDEDSMDVKKKALEIAKLEKELVKIDHETTEIRWKKYSAWGPTIIAVCSLIFIWANGFLDAKSALVKAETLNLEGKREALNITIKKLYSEKDSLSKISFLYISEIKSQEKEIKKSEELIDNLGSKISIYRKEVSRKEIEIGGLRNDKNTLSSEISKVENCFPKAKEFLLKYCVKTNLQGMSMDSIIRMISPPPYKTRFNKPLDEIAKMDISKMNYIQFLEVTANFRVRIGNLTVDVISEDGLVQVIKEANRGNMTIRQAPTIIADITTKFECYKNLGTNQKLKLLNEVTRRIN